MSFFQAEVDANATDALAQAREGGGDGKFPPLPKGEYSATVVPLKKDGSSRVEVVDFGGTGANAKKKVLRVALKINADSPTGAGRTFFARVPMFSRYAPNQKNPAGAPARQYFDFFGAMGVSDEALTSGNLGIGPDQILGKPINIVLSDPKEPDEYNPLGSNEVSFYNKPGPANTPVRVAGQPVAPWLDADDNLIGGAQPAAKPQAAATAPPADPWGVTDQDIADAQAQAPAMAGATAAGPWATAPSF